MNELIKKIKDSNNSNDRIDIIKNIADGDLDDFFVELKNEDIKLYYNVKSIIFFSQLKVNAPLSIILLIICFVANTYLNGKQANSMSLIFLLAVWLGTTLICGKTIWILVNYLIYKLKQ